ncbi:hypothetical protein [Pseudoalteromonas sp. T1lg23B]|uniref:hypothetical protein n=1 Tax=Pseudoalteromonas sp. T1lg23B TaxID=2077097 RepID=UPI000CF604CB|nr:hypothetical protein [Pseudoalteromonas sp. T1lg23B]
MKRYYIGLMLSGVILCTLIIWLNHDPQPPVTLPQNVNATNRTIIVEPASEALHLADKQVEHTPAAAKAQSNDTDANNIDAIDVYVPPIAEPTHTPAYQGDLNDYEQYQAFGEAQERKLKQQYIDAAADKVKRLEALLARGRAEGISKEELTFAQQKIAGIKAMSEELRLELEDHTQ